MAFSDLVESTRVTTRQRAFEGAVLAPIALDRARVLTPLGFAAIAWYSTVGHAWGIELTRGAATFNGAACLLLAVMWCALVGGRVPAKWGHFALGLLWLVCVAATLQSRLISNSAAFDFLMMLEILCGCMLLRTRSAVIAMALLDVGYALAAHNLRDTAPVGFIPAVVACNMLGLVLQISFQRTELLAAVAQRAQHRRASARARQLAELESLQRDRAVLAEQVAASQRIEAAGTLAASLAHELNNLFTSISLSAGLLVRRAKPERRRDFQVIEEESVRGARLTSKLLEFSRSSSTPRVALGVEKVIANSAELMARMLPRMIELEVRIDTDDRVMVDPVQLSQVLLNLSLNAARALDNRGTITIQAQRVVAPAANTRALGLANGTYVEIAVVDRGSGMDDVTRTRAVDPFFTTERMGNGAGLGLSTAWNIMRAHAGALAIDSQRGVGTTVRIYIPVCLGVES
ncbi:hypothetical protein BH11MYX1_BH11MYX1_43940 [soil metagenome]